MSARGRISDVVKKRLASSRMLSITEAADILSVCEKTVRNHIKSGSLSCSRIGGRVVVPQAAVEEFVAANLILGRIA